MRVSCIFKKLKILVGVIYSFFADSDLNSVFIYVPFFNC